MFEWALGLLFVGAVVVSVGTPRIDRRFRTGFKHNAIPNTQVVGTGLLAMLLGFVLFLVWCNSPVEHHPDIPAQVDMTTPAPTPPTPPDMAAPHHKHHKKKTPTEEPYELMKDNGLGDGKPIID